MTSFFNMILPAFYTCNDVRPVHMFHAQFGECPLAVSWSISSTRAGLRYK